MALRRQSPFGSGVKRSGVLAALAGVGLAAEAVHGDGQGLVGLGRDRAVGHRAGGEPLDDRRDRLDLLERDGRRPARPVAEPEQPAQGGQLAGLVVDRLVYSLKIVVALVPGWRAAA